MSKQIKTASSMQEIVKRLNAYSEKWQKYDEASENQAIWMKQRMKVQEDIGLLCLKAVKEDDERYEDYDAGAAWEKMISKLKKYDPDREHRDGTKVLLGEYLQYCLRWIIIEVINDKRDLGERKARDVERKKEERNRGKGKTETEKNVGSIAFDTVTGHTVDQQGNEIKNVLPELFSPSAEEQAWKNKEESEKEKGDKLLSDLVMTMMAMSLNFDDYRKRLRKRGKAEQEIYMKMCYTERLVWVEMMEQLLCEMDRNAQKDILRAMLNSYYWYWADGKMVYDAEWERRPVYVGRIVTAEIKNLRWMRRAGGKNKGWLELDIPVDYIKDSQGKNVNKARISEARTRYTEEIAMLNEMAYGRDSRL